MRRDSRAPFEDDGPQIEAAATYSPSLFRQKSLPTYLFGFFTRTLKHRFYNIGKLHDRWRRAEMKRIETSSDTFKNTWRSIRNFGKLSEIVNFLAYKVCFRKMQI